MIEHTVLFRLRRPLDPANSAAFLSALNDFSRVAPHVCGPVKIENDLGLRERSNPRTADVLLHMTFPNTAAFAAYLDDPLHRALTPEVFEVYCEAWLSVQNQMG